MHYKALIIICSLTGTAPVYAADEIESKNEWTIGFSGGATLIEGNSDQQFVSLSLSKEIGDSYLGISATYVDSGRIPGLVASIPASTKEITVSAGTSVDALALDTYLSIAKRNFDEEFLQRNGLTASISSSGNAFGVGGSIGYDFALNDNLFLTPSIGVDYNELDIARVAQGPNGGQSAIENTENGVTGTLGLAIQKIFGTEQNHVASLIANGVTTSNTTSFNPGNDQSAVLRALATRDDPGQSDSWAELGVALSFAITESLRLDMSALQTIGFLNSDAISLSTGVRFSF